LAYSYYNIVGRGLTTKPTKFDPSDCPLFLAVVELFMVSLSSYTQISFLALLVTACGTSPKKNPDPGQSSTGEQSTKPSTTTDSMRTVTTSSGIPMQIPSDRAENINPKLAFVFQGKGTALSWDIGSVKAAYERLPLLRRENSSESIAAGDVVITGNSSGSVLAAWFSCRGFTAESIKGAESILSQFPNELVNEDTTSKLLDVLEAMTAGREFGSPINTITPLVDSITGKGTCFPRLPTVIVASNQDINDKRRWLATKDELTRVFDIRDYSYWEKSASTSFQARKVGKVCTYFADPVMFRYLTESMPADERLCDVRLMENAQDMKLAVLASIAEPTYFMPVPETLESKLVRYSVPGTPRAPRVYNGGFSMPGVIQDVKRIFPEVRALGSGRWEYGATEVTILQRWYDVPLNNVQDNSRWWMDLETFPTEAQKTALLDRPKGISGASLAQRYGYEINLGYQRAMACLQKGRACIPARRIANGKEINRPTLTRPVGKPNGAEIKTRQGLDAFLQ
jgi:hypothetical protein